VDRKLMGKKCGMVRLYGEDGSPIACTVVRIEPNVVTQIKTKETDGYTAVQIGFDEVKASDPRTVEKRVTKPQLGHFKKAGVAPRRHLLEIRVDDVDGYSLGQEIGADIFDGVSFVDVTARSKGKGYQGVMKKYGFAGMKASHGTGPTHRHAGSTGMRSTPGRCLPGGPRPSHMGDNRVTIQSLRVVRVDAEKGLVLIEGTVPGAKNGLVVLSNAKKK